MTNRTNSTDARWLTPGDASAALGITTTHLARLADKGEIRAIRRAGGGHRRYAADDIEAILAREPWDPA